MMILCTFLPVSCGNTRSQGPVICSCNGAVNFLLDWDKDAQYRLAALQSKAGSELLQQAGRKPDDLSSVVLVEPGQAYVKSEAVLRIGRRLNTPFFVLGSMGLPVPSFIRDAAYDLVCKVTCDVAEYLRCCCWHGAVILLDSQHLLFQVFFPDRRCLPDCRWRPQGTKCGAKQTPVECAIHDSKSASLTTDHQACKRAAPSDAHFRFEFRL